MKKILFPVVLICVLAFINCTPEEKKNETTTTVEEWKLVYKNDKNGNQVFGKKDELISNIRKGNSIKIGWASRRRSDTTKTVEHTVDAEFLTIANGNQVFAQIKPFLAQRPDLTNDTLSMTLLPIASNWVLGTNGIISSVSIDYGKDSVRTSPPKLFGYALSWFSKSSSLSKKEKPLWD